MKRFDARTLRDEAYHIIDESDGDVSLLQAVEKLENSPKDAEAYLMLAESAEEKDRLDKALLLIDYGLLHHPDHSALLLKKASLLLDGFEDVDEAFKILNGLKLLIEKEPASSIKNIDPDIVLDVFLLLTDCYRLKNDFNEAFKHAKKAQALSPHDEQAILAVATAYFELGKFDEALNMIEAMDSFKDQSDFFWLKGQILCAMGELKASDEAFHMANRLDKNRYHRPIRVSQSSFFSAFEQAALALPKEIRDFMNGLKIEIKAVVSPVLIKEMKGTLSPEACIYVDNQEEKSHVLLFQHNIENLALKKSDLRDLIASALLHELGKALHEH